MVRPASVLIDASNLHVGGGVQAAASLVDELSRIVASAPSDWSAALTVQVSSSVASYATVSDAPFRMIQCDSRFGAWSVPDGPWDLALTVFGPAYRPRVAEIEVVGIAIPHLGYGYPRLGQSPWNNFRARAANTLKKRYARRADVLVTETHHFAESLGRALGGARVEVIANAPSTRFLERSAGAATGRPASEGSQPLRAACVARDYPHKNLDFLVPLGRSLQQRLNRPVVFEVTLSAGEWGSRTAAFRQATVNNGVVGIDELVRLYSRCDFAVLPSLLEVASVMPLESMAMGLPTFVSDRPFMRSMLGDAVTYIDPLDPDGSAMSIAAVLSDAEGTAAQVQRGHQLLAELPTAAERAEALVRLIDELLLARNSGPVRT